MSETTAQEIVIEGSRRTATGKGNNHRLRLQGRIPANLMTKGQSIAIDINSKYLPKAFKAGKTFVLAMDGKNQKVKIHELCVHPVTRSALHVDLIPIA